jgi:ribosome-associated protein
MSSRRPQPPHDDVASEPASKTQLKREMHALQQLGESLAELSEERLAAIELPEPLREAVQVLRRTRSHEGRRRQVQYVGKLMRTADVEPIREAVAAARLGPARAALALHEAEHWREALLASDEAIGGWLAAHPASDVQHLRSLLRAARSDARAAAANEAPGAAARKGRAYRELFRFIRQEAS